MIKEKFQVSYLLYVYYLITLIYIYFDEGGFIKTIEIIVWIILFWCHIQINFTEPGPINVKKTPIELMEELKQNNLSLILKNQEQLNVYCKLCKQWKPPKTHHCKTCKICIHYRDHHCRWLNCCIGFQNLKFFTQFLAYLMLQQCLSCYQVLIFIKENLTQCHEKMCLIHFDWIDPLYFIVYASTPLILRSIIIKLGVQVSYELFVDKLHQIPDLDTYNEQKQDKYMYYKNFPEKFVSLFSSNIIYWFLPLRNPIKLNYLELTYPKVTSGQDLLDYHLNEKDENYYFYRQFEIK